MSKISKNFLLGSISAILFFGTPNLAMAGVPSDSSIALLAQVSHFDESFKRGVKKGAMSNLIKKLRDDPKFQRLTPSEQQRYQSVVENFGEKVVQDINTPDLTQRALTAFIATNKKYYSQEEVNGLISFYQSPIGQSIIKKQLLVYEEFTQDLTASLRNDPQFYQKIIDSVTLHSTEMMEEIKKIKIPR